MQNKNIGLVLYLFLMVVLSFGCRKDYSLEGGALSHGTLQSSAGDCLAQQSDTLSAGKNINDSNFLILSVNVKTSGRYFIRTDTINGFSFTADGAFADTGLVTVRLKGRGTPKSPGTYILSVYYDSSVCKATIEVSQNPNDAKAVYNLLGTPDICMQDTILGVFAQANPLTGSNAVIISVNVIAKGKFNIATPVINGYSFSAAGVFDHTGLQTVRLAAVGIPAVKGTDFFSVPGSNSNCTFSNVVVDPVNTVNLDHFPMTGSSFLSYDDVPNPPDTILRVIVGTNVLNQNLYKEIAEIHRFGSPISFNCRKADTIYYEYCSVDKYTTSLKFSPQVNADIIFLKENLRTSESWFSDEYTGYINSTEKEFLRYRFICEDAGATVTVNGKTFINVYKIAMYPTLHSVFSNDYADTGEKSSLYYARGIGLIYTKIDIPLNGSRETKIKNWLVY